MKKIKNRPMISVTSTIGGLLTGIGILVILQQMGTVYPTLNVTILAAVLGIVWGIGLPTLLRTMKVRKVNRQLASRAA